MFYFLSLSAALFAIGMYGFLARRNFPGKLLSFFIMLQAIVLNFAAFNRFVQSSNPSGVAFNFFILIVLMCQMLCAGFLVFQWSRQIRKGVEDSLNLLK